MKKAALLATVFALFCTSPVLAATAKKPLSTQQNRMKECNVLYRQKKIPKHEHKAFLKQCLKKNKTSDAAKPTTIDNVLASMRTEKK